MRTMIEEQNKKAPGFAALGKSWNMFVPTLFHSDEQDRDEFSEARAALMQAEAVIRAQEDRIRALEEMTLTDELTTLVNRRGFMAALERELALSRRDMNYRGIVVMVDLDGFKAINDRWGHQAGDVYLRTVAQVLRASVRASDIVARLGGDEFALLLPHVEEKNGAMCTAKIAQAFSEQAAMLHERIPLRASFGFAAYSAADKAEQLMQIADVRLYAHKARNKRLIAAG